MAPERLIGRVEHMASGRMAHGHTSEELLAFIARVVAADCTHPPTPLYASDVPQQPLTREEQR